jgi:hypothetical protein
MDERRLVLYGDLSMGRLPSILSVLEPAWDPFAPPLPMHLDLSDVTFIWPCVITLLTTAVLRLKQEGFRIRVTRPVESKVDGYLNRIDFYELVGMPVYYPWQRHDAQGRFREAVQVQSEAEGDAVVREVMEILDRNVGAIQGVRDAVYHAFLEIVNNVFHHAQSPTHAVLCAQSYPNQQRVELAVVDSGRGIPNSLAGNPALAGRFSTAAEAIELAVQPRVTGRPGQNTGEGLFFALEFVKANWGKACIYSQNGVLWVQNANMTSSPAAFWPGTVVALRFCTDVPVDVRTIFNRYAPPENDFAWLF